MVVDKLLAAGLSPDAAREQAENFAKAERALGPQAGAARRFYIPGRLEFLGKHTDYAGGRSLIAAVDRGIAVVAVDRSDTQVRVIDSDTGSVHEFDLSPDLVLEPGAWGNYARTVARRLARNFPGCTRGATIALASNLPRSAGMSSSSAMMIGIFHALSATNDLPARAEYRAAIPNRIALAEYLGCVENGQTYGPLAGDAGVGTFGGSEDHTAILNAVPDHLSQYSYCPTRLERVIPLPPNHVIAIAVSGVVAEKTAAAKEKYNRISRAAATLVRISNQLSGRNDQTLADVISDPNSAIQLSERVASRKNWEGGFTGEELSKRLMHFVRESDRVAVRAGDVLIAGSLYDLGIIVDDSRRYATDLLGNQIDETIRLACIARILGAAAASPFGAGFGGSVWALVQVAQTVSFIAEWRRRYLAEFPQHADAAQFIPTHVGPPAFEVPS